MGIVPGEVVPPPEVVDFAGEAVVVGALVPKFRAGGKDLVGDIVFPCEAAIALGAVVRKSTAGLAVFVGDADPPPGAPSVGMNVEGDDPGKWRVGTTVDGAEAIAGDKVIVGALVVAPLEGGCPLVGVTKLGARAGDTVLVGFAVPNPFPPTTAGEPVPPPNEGGPLVPPEDVGRPEPEPPGESDGVPPPNEGGPFPLAPKLGGPFPAAAGDFVPPPRPPAAGCPFPPAAMAVG